MKRIPVFMLMALAFACKGKKEELIVDQTEEIVEEAPVEVVEFGYNLNDYTVQKDTVKSGDSFGEILLNHRIGYSKIAEIAAQVKDTFDVTKIRAGKTYTLLKTKDTTEKAQVFIYKHDNINYTIVDFKDSLVNAVRYKKPVKIVEREATGVIETTLSDAVLEQGIDYEIINKMSDVYAWTVDFFRLQKGDRFKVIYKEKYIEDSIYAGSGEIIAAYFEHKEQPFYAFRYENDSILGTVDYYDDEANTLRRAFLRAPVKFSRISSRYNLRRRIAYYGNRVRPHKGTDYAANVGTPILATANGTVVASSYTRGNGKYVKIRHNSTYSTQYLHMQNRNVKVGDFVKQGDVIGWVGMTGNTSGPHVCYRFWKNGRQVDPYKQDLPAAEPIKPEIKDSYLKFIRPLVTQLDCIEFHEKKEVQEEYLTELNDINETDNVTNNRQSK
ncbi:peptidoglycan DD-metalloendopeptidase family protein [Leptobacterium flavescens]|uniref:Peptidoglycan DD-metalloendopeptidase family protein n=1 Tax=Leptobacterium flavescens TaxID=472055 RepID=A0A6P0UM88_9FLAO|nr:peptidoglycan DD-metalloendopeptidase family protein [Leptobacterium flavescens]NER14461.1 peptidoglycan DD-metalloendopeptidase family protein [Leptobacterium flavescens]